MKRKGAVPDEEQDKKKSAVDGIAVRTRSATRAAAFKLTDFADDLLGKVYSYLSFKDRMVTRGLCNRLLKFVDESTQGANKLSISVVPVPASGRTRRRQPFVICMQPDNEDPESSVLVEIELPISVRRFSDTQAKVRSLPKLLASLSLRSIRPKIFSLTIDAEIAAPRELFTGLMKRMTEQQVPLSVEEFDLFYSEPYEPNPEVQQAFLAFERSSRIRKLTLRDSVNFFLTTVARFTQLESLTLYPRHDEQEGALYDLASLSAHPTLRELQIYSQILYADLMTSLASFKNIQKLDFFCTCDMFGLEEDEEEEDEEENVVDEQFFNAFVNMIRGMENIERLGTLHYPSIKFWQRLVENNVTSNRLQELKILYGEDSTTPGHLEKMVQGLQTFAPSLTTLFLRIERGWYGEWEENEVLKLSELRQHPSLCKLELATESDIGQETLSNLQQELGHRVKLSHVPYDSDSSFY